ncbi:MAG TPA: spermidine/putrescine ABC transporter substrate-binding protein [Candidatus Limnocylindrales bacterium]|nr:spermidine/putrescine ABC transporter substrate-binding protein [Candidatus Limnocylindrales bacterium]
MASREYELEAIVRRVSANAVTRRRFLAATGFTSMAAFIAACTPGTSPSASTSAAPSTAASTEPSTAESPSAAASPSAVAVTETEGTLLMYNWADYVDPDNIEKFKKDFKVTDFQYDTYASNEELLTKLQGGAAGQWDVGAPTCEFVKAMVEGDFIEKLDWSKLPNAALIDPQFQNFYKGADADLNNYHLPKDWGTTGISIRTKDVKEEVKTWKQFFEVAPKYSGRIVVVDSPGDVFVAPLKSLGYSLNSVDPKELGEAREILRAFAPHVLALNSDTYDAQLANEECVLGLTWTGGIADLAEKPETADTKYVIPEDGTLYWMDTWVIFKNPPHPNAAYAFLNFIQDPEVQAKESETNRYATANTEAKKLVDPKILADPTVFVPDDVVKSGLLEGAQDVSTNPLRQEIWEEFKSSIGKH